MELFDIFIPTVPKDFHKLKFLLQSIRENISGFDKIHISVPDVEQYYNFYRMEFSPNKNSVYKRNPNYHGGIHVHPEKNILDIDISKFKYRPNWLYQMYLKMFQNVTENDLFLTIDSDVIINRPVKLFSESIQHKETLDGVDIYGISNKRLLWMGWEQNHRPYFEFQEKMLNLPREYPHTFINDTNFMSKSIIKEMLERNSYTQESFIEKSFDVIHGPHGTGCFPAEPEIWGQYAMKYHSDKYEPYQMKTIGIGRPVSTIEEVAWSDADIEQQIEEMKTKDVDMFMLHSWYV